MDTKQSPTNLRFSFGVVNCLVVFPTHFNQNNSLLIILQISLLLMFTPALNLVLAKGSLDFSNVSNWATLSK